MTTISQVSITLVDLAPKVKRVDAIQSFISQETPIVTITDSDGATGTGYSYTIGTGGPSVIALLRLTLAPALIGKDPDRIEGIWRDLLLSTHATAVGAITSLALATIDTALWDLKCKKAKLPLWKAVGGVRDCVPLYTTEGGWLHIETDELVADALKMQAQGFKGAKIKIGRNHLSQDAARLSAVRAAVGDSFEIMTDANQSFSSVTFSPTPAACWSVSSFMPLTSWIGTEHLMFWIWQVVRIPGCAIFLPMVDMPGRNYVVRSRKSATGLWKSSSVPTPQRASKSSQGDGWSSGPLHGSIAIAGWPRTSREPSPVPKHGFTLPTFRSSSGEWQELDIKRNSFESDSKTFRCIRDAMDIVEIYISA